MPDERIFAKDEKEPANPHEKGVTTFARYFANDLAQSVIYQTTPKFPVGAIIVREKLVTEDAEIPSLVTVMVKREKGFSKKTGDWEYFVIEGGVGKIIKREKEGSCSKCHANASETDFVFKTYLK